MIDLILVNFCNHFGSPRTWEKRLLFLNWSNVCCFLYSVTVADYTENQSVRHTHVWLWSTTEGDIVGIPNFDGI